MDVWGEIIGAAAVQKPAEQQLPNGAVRIHVGVFKAFLNSAQGVGSTRFGVFFGGFWKKEKNTPLYRCNHFVMGGHLQKLLNSQSVKDAAGQSRQVLGVGMVELSPDPVRCDVPSTALLEALKSIPEAADTLVVMQASIGPTHVKPSLRVFELERESFSPRRVWLKFLTKRLGNEQVFVCDADADGKKLNVAELVNEVVGVPCKGEFLFLEYLGLEFPCNCVLCQHVRTYIQYKRACRHTYTLFWNLAIRCGSGTPAWQAKGALRSPSVRQVRKLLLAVLGAGAIPEALDLDAWERWMAFRSRSERQRATAGSELQREVSG